MISSSLSLCPGCQRSLPATQEWNLCPSCTFPLRLLLDRYRLEEEIGQGGAGCLYRAYDLQEQTQRAVKILRPELFEQKELEIRFWREVRVTRQLSQLNPHIIQLYEHGKDEFIGNFYSMEYLEGQTVQQWMEEATELSFQDIFHVIRQLCSVLQDVHDADVLHRDLSPANLFLVERNGDSLFLKLLDFGVAKALEGTAHSQLTQGMIGTPGYIPPEQWLGLDVDARGDQYSLAILVYELLTGERPFASKGSSVRAIMTLMHQHLEDVPLSLQQKRPELNFPFELDRVLQRALHKKPEERFPSISAFWDALQPFASLEVWIPKHSSGAWQRNVTQL